MNYQSNNVPLNNRNQQNFYSTQQNIYSNNVVQREIPVKNQSIILNHPNNNGYGYIV